MAYEKTEWQNGVTPLSADNMNHIEEGISQLDQSLDDIDKGNYLISMPINVIDNVARMSHNFINKRQYNITINSGNISGREGAIDTSWIQKQILNGSVIFYSLNQEVVRYQGSILNLVITVS